MQSNNIWKTKLPFSIIEAPENFPDFTGISYNSLHTIPGDIFVAVKGFTADGHDYIVEAVKKGAAGIICERKIKNIEIPQIIVSDSRRALSFISAAFYDFPSQKINIIGITGTNGKTTTGTIIEKILEGAGKNPGFIGTIDSHFILPDKTVEKTENSTTTPESKDLQEIIRRMKDNHVTDIIIEVSSHAAELLRVADVNFNTVVFTNLTQDHLDFHKTMENYWKVKKDFLITRIEGYEQYLPAKGIINSDDEYGKSFLKFFREKNKKNIYSFSAEHDADFKAESIEIKLNNTTGTIKFENKSYNFSSKLSGRHNTQNILAAFAASVCSGVSPEKCSDLIQNAKSIAGRLEQVKNSKRPFIFVDYAHTPDALENVLKSLKPLCKNRLISVFGCGGDRDRKKRALMGKISGELADITIITSDNPRTEDPDFIISEIEQGIKSSAVKTDTDNILKTKNSIYITEPDRRKAINKAIAISREDDCILIAGKGHEDYQITGRTKVSFDDNLVAREEVEKIYGS
ncbi:MAG: UDP-N-acetylmuramoyl-L-alanyl-D-glutamate--2,6-diaminopimelate ligase [Thermodesulfobacteriota bacterium]